MAKHEMAKRIAWKLENKTLVVNLIVAIYIHSNIDDVKHHTNLFFKHFYHGTNKLTHLLTQKS
jgi:hypothetical protein